LNKNLSSSPTRDAPSLRSPEREVLEANPAALLAQLKVTTERLVVAIQAGASQTVRTLPSEGLLLEDELLSEEELARGPSGGRITASELKRLSGLRARRRRNAPSEFFNWPTWDMLIHLLAVRADGGHASVSSVCTACGAPQSTALRKLTDLEDAKLVRRYLRSSDRRRIFITITDRAAEMIIAALHDEIAIYDSIAASQERERERERES
jgi:DNA-binding MarR family transcriptional regulator